MKITEKMHHQTDFAFVSVPLKVDKESLQVSDPQEKVDVSFQQLESQPQATKEETPVKKRKKLFGSKLANRLLTSALAFSALTAIVPGISFGQTPKPATEIVYSIDNKAETERQKLLDDVNWLKEQGFTFTSTKNEPINTTDAAKIILDYESSLSTEKFRFYDKDGNTGTVQSHTDFTKLKGIYKQTYTGLNRTEIFIASNLDSLREKGMNFYNPQGETISNFEIINLNRLDYTPTYKTIDGKTGEINNLTSLIQLRDYKVDPEVQKLLNDIKELKEQGFKFTNTKNEPISTTDAAKTIINYESSLSTEKFRFYDKDGNTGTVQSHTDFTKLKGIYKQTYTGLNRTEIFIASNLDRLREKGMDFYNQNGQPISNFEVINFNRLDYTPTYKTIDSRTGEIDGLTNLLQLTNDYKADSEAQNLLNDTRNLKEQGFRFVSTDNKPISTNDTARAILADQSFRFCDKDGNTGTVESRDEFTKLKGIYDKSYTGLNRTEIFLISRMDNARQKGMTFYNPQGEPISNFELLKFRNLDYTPTYKAADGKTGAVTELRNFFPFH